MKRIHALWGSALFTVVVPATIAGLLPWLITKWRPGHGMPAAVRLVAIVLIAAGLAVLLQAIYQFAVAGLGTPAPIAPTQHLVVTGPNRYVRNPMYLAVVAVIAGQALLLSSAGLLCYGAVVATGQALFVRWYEEPALHRRFGAEYVAYRKNVRAWLPRTTGWRPAMPDHNSG